MDNRRSSPRSRCQCRAEVRVIDLPQDAKPAGGVMSCLTTDISVGGTRVTLCISEIAAPDLFPSAAEPTIPVGAKVSVSLTCPDSRRRFDHVGVVRWTKHEPGSPVAVIGVEFTGSPRPVMTAWLAYLRTHFVSPGGVVLPAGGPRRL